MTFPVHKFGGGVLRSPEQLLRLPRQLEAATGGLIVVSAFHGVTQRLETMVNDAWEGRRDNARRQWARLYATHRAWAEKVLRHPEEYARVLPFTAEDAFPVPEEETSYGAFYDAVVSRGERMASLLVWQYLQQLQWSVRWVDARELVVTDDRHTAACVDWEATRRRIAGLRALLRPGEWFVTQGFIGRSRDGRPTTLGKEGSDYSAALFAAALDAPALWLWKNVPGILTADPRWDPHARTIPALSHDDARRLGELGAQVLHPLTLEVSRRHRMAVRVAFFEDPRQMTIVKEDVPPLSLRGMVVRTVRAVFLPCSAGESFRKLSRAMALKIIAEHPMGRRLLVVGDPNPEKWREIRRHLPHPFEDDPFEAFWVTLLGGYPMPRPLRQMQTITRIPYAHALWQGEQLLVRG